MCRVGGCEGGCVRWVGVRKCRVGGCEEMCVNRVSMRECV